MMASKLNRRAVLAGIGAAASSAALAVPVAASVAPAPEHPNDKVRRLGSEIREALNDPRFVGFKQVTITPEWVGYSEDASELTQVKALIDAHEKAWLVFNLSCDAADSLSENYGGPAAERRMERLSRKEEKAFQTLLSFPTRTTPGTGAKTTYLLTTINERWIPDFDSVATLLSASRSEGGAA